MALDVLLKARKAVVDEADLSAQPNSPQARSWVSCSHEDPCGASNPEAPTDKEPKASRSLDSVQVEVDTGTGRFGRADRILTSREYREIGRHGRRVTSDCFVILMARGDVGRRVGITVSKKVGNAVVRNRVKRGIREWFRRSRAQLRARVDLVIIAKPAARRLRGRELASALDRLMAGAEA